MDEIEIISGENYKITNNVEFKKVKQACIDWHYSKGCPTNNIYKFGVYENGEFIGIILFGYGANYQIAKRFGLVQGEVIELTRIALDSHINPVTMYVAKILKWIRMNNESIKVIISYADEGEGHTGQIYKAGGWHYDGVRKLSGYDYWYNDKWTHQKTLWDKSGGTTAKFNEFVKDLPKRKKSNKHRYVMYMNKRIRKQYEKTSKISG